jgi:hypothetical protein
MHFDISRNQTHRTTKVKENKKQEKKKLEKKREKIDTCTHKHLIPSPSMHMRKNPPPTQTQVKRLQQNSKHLSY